MRKSYLFILILPILFLILIGCLDFGIDLETTSPTQDQVNRCCSEMYLNPLTNHPPLILVLQGLYQSGHRTFSYLS